MSPGNIFIKQQMKVVFKNLYSLLPFKQQLFSVVRKMVVLPNSISKHLYFNGIVSFKVNDRIVRMNQKGYDVENTLFWRGTKGCWEKVSVGIWIRLSGVSKMIFDVGANTGAYALIAKAASPDAVVYAVEPLKMISERLEANIALNKMDIKCIPFAMSDFDGVAKVYLDSLDHIYSVTVNKNLSPANVPVHEVEIQTKKMSTLIEDEKIEFIDLIKIDVETHEPEMLRGMGDYLRKWKPTLIIEILTDEVGQSVEQILSGMDYLYFNVDENQGIRQVDHIGKSDYYNYIICSAEKAKFLNLV